VQAEALPFLRAMFMGIFGMLMFFMLSGAFRAAGDPQTPLRLGVIMTVLTIVFNVILIPMFGTLGAALGTILSSTTVTVYGIWRITRPDSVIHFEKGMSHAPDFTIIRSLFRFGLPTGVQGIAMNIGGVLMLRFIGSLEQSAAAQAAYAVGYTELFSLITWTSVGLMGASATIAGQNLGANNPQRAIDGVKVAAQIGLGVAVVIGAMFVLIPGPLLAIFGMTDPVVLSIGRLLLLYLSVSGLFITVALSYTGGLQGTGDTRSPLFISIISQVIIPLGLCTLFQAMYGLDPAHIWTAIVVGHATRATLSVVRFKQGKWRSIAVDIEPQGLDLQAYRLAVARLCHGNTSDGLTPTSFVLRTYRVADAATMPSSPRPPSPRLWRSAVASREGGRWKSAAAIPPRVFRHRVRVASNHLGQFEPRSGCRHESATRRTGTGRVQAEVDFPACGGAAAARYVRSRSRPICSYAR
jgi:putative MATE family efflux protein